MLGVDSLELLVIAIVALLVIGPKDLPVALRWLGQMMSKARSMARHFQHGVDAMMREAELEDLEKKWATENKLRRMESAADPLPDQFCDDGFEVGAPAQADGGVSKDRHQPVDTEAPENAGEAPLVKAGV